MSLRLLAIGAAAVTVVASALPAAAQDSIYVPLLTYRTGAFAGSGIPIANGMRDYLTMLNERDGGIGGVKINIEECETGYDTKKGVECYESVKGKNPAVVNPYSTGITLQLIPRAAVDKIPVLSMAYGLSASSEGDYFPWVFNPPSTYWDGASMHIRYIGQQEGGLDKLKGKKIALLHLDAPYGKEPIPLLEALAKKYGYELKLYPVAGQDMQNQGAVWLNVRRDRPDWIILQGWGAMNPTAVKEAIRTGYPIGKMVGIWWSGSDDDARGGGAEAKGYKALHLHQAGAQFPALQEVKKHVVDKGLSQVDKDKFGEMFYNRGVYNSMIVAEAIRNAQKITGKKVVTGEDVRQGLESLNIDEARFKELGLADFGAPVKTTCNDHNGHGKAFVAEWDGSKWVKSSDWIEPIKEEVQPLLEQAAKDYVASNTGWPKRNEACAKSS